MKSIIQIGLIALVLFSVSAGLSIWLYQSRQPAEETPAEKEKAGRKGEANGERERPEKEPAPKSIPRPSRPPAWEPTRRRSPTLPVGRRSSPAGRRRST
jgi:hypothetical protein